MPRLRDFALGACLVLIVAASCTDGDSAPSTTQAPATSTTSDTTQVASTSATGVPETTAVPEPTGFDIDALLAKDPLVIFNAYPPKPEHITYQLPPGQRDYDELWEPGAPWQTALEHVDIYRLHAFQLRHFMDDDQVRTLIGFLREHDIPLMLETEPLLPADPDVCAHFESFEAPFDLEMAARLKDLGGQIDVIAIEEPYSFGHLLDTADACQYSVERVVLEVLQHVENLRELFGDIPVGTIEPIWASPATEPGDMEIWLDTFEAIAGEPFAFLHIDPNWYRPDWADVARGIEAVADARGVPFGILYNGGVEPNGLAWMNFMMANAFEFEIAHGGTPQHVSFQSWVDWPDHALPEDDLTALTSSIVRYFGQRLEISAEAADGGVRARVTDLDGKPVEGVRLEVGKVPEVRSVGTQTIQGVVPDGISEALVLVRANAENATPGEAAVTLHEVSFSVGGDDSNLVPNGSFDAGIENWGVYGSDPGRVDPVAVDSGRGLAITATPAQDVFIDGAVFPVTAGVDYELSVTYEIDGGSPDSVVVSVAFVGVTRANIYLHHLPESLGSFVTDGDGVVQVSGDGDPARFVISSAGDLDRWPVTVSLSTG